ncbi:MAG TPA: hypothetical protein VIT65_11460 [Microlunatus sp.]
MPAFSPPTPVDLWSGDLDVGMAEVGQPKVRMNRPNGGALSLYLQLVKFTAKGAPPTRLRGSKVVA